MRTGRGGIVEKSAKKPLMASTPINATQAVTKIQVPIHILFRRAAVKAVLRKTSCSPRITTAIQSSDRAESRIAGNSLGFIGSVHHKYEPKLSYL